MPEVQIKGRITRDKPEDMFICFRPKSPAPAPSVLLPRSEIAVVQDVEFVIITMPLWLAEKKGLEEFI